MLGSKLQSFYENLWNIRDKRVDDWILMSTPWPTLLICAAYFYISTNLGHSVMKGRRPFELKRAMQTYNVIQVGMSIYIFVEACLAGWLTGYSWVCQDVDRNTDPDSSGMRMVRVSYMYFLSKFTEFADTFFFLARKKFEHVSFLQVIHHGIMPLYGWVLVRWLPGGHETFGGTVNCLVHVLMYSYYFLASLGPEMQKYLYWKRYLTTFQMIQFVVVFVKSLVVILGIVECGYPWQFSLISTIIMTLFFGLFLQFYMKEYTRKGSSKVKK